LLFSSSTNEYQFTRASGANIVTINPAGAGYTRLGDPDEGNFAEFTGTGDLSFAAGADYLVGNNRDAFRAAADEDFGLFFDAGNLRYELRDASASRVWVWPQTPVICTYLATW
jgi:hypothetical protein